MDPPPSPTHALPPTQLMSRFITDAEMRVYRTPFGKLMVRTVIKHRDSEWKKKLVCEPGDAIRSAAACVETPPSTAYVRFSMYLTVTDAEWTPESRKLVRELRSEFARDAAYNGDTPNRALRKRF